METSAPSATQLTLSLILCSSGRNTQGDSRALEQLRVSSKIPSRVQDGDKGVACRNRREKCFLIKGSLQINDILPSPEYLIACDNLGIVIVGVVKGILLLQIYSMCYRLFNQLK